MEIQIEKMFIFVSFPINSSNAGNCSCLCSHLLTFFKIIFSKNSFRNTIRMSNGLDPDQDQHSVSSDLDPNCLQRLSADNKSPLARQELIFNFCLHAYVKSMSRKGSKETAQLCRLT